MSGREAALARLAEDGLTKHEVGMRIMRALEEGASESEVADRLGMTTDELRRDYAGALEEAGRLGQIRHPNDPPPATDARPLYRED